MFMYRQKKYISNQTNVFIGGRLEYSNRLWLKFIPEQIPLKKQNKCVSGIHLYLYSISISNEFELIYSVSKLDTQ